MLVICPPYSAAVQAVVDNSVDQYFNNVALLMHMNDAAFTDLKAGTVTNTGSVAYNTSTYKFATGSAQFNGSNRLTVTTTALGSGDYTVEAWFYVTTTGTVRQILSSRPTTSPLSDVITLNINSSDKLEVYTGGVATAGSTTVTANVWHHGAIVRSGTSIYLFLDGVSQITQTDSTNQTRTTVYIGANGDTAQALTGFIDDVRITKGVARYTSNFAVPTAAFPDSAVTLAPSSTVLLMHMEGANNSTVLIDQTGKTVTSAAGTILSTSIKKIGTSSVQCTGAAGARFSVAASTDFLWPGDFTLEFWLYVPNLVDTRFPLSNAASSAIAGTSWSFEYRANGIIGMYMAGGNETYHATSGTGALAANTWTHVAWCRSGTTAKMFVNGTQIGSFTLTGDLGSATLPITGGSMINGEGVANCYFDEIRVLKGVAAYTANFIPPIVAFADPVPDVYYSQVPLLLHMDGLDTGTTFIDEKGKVCTASGATTSITQSKFGLTSALFTARTDKINLPTSTDFDLVGDFTVEAWVYPNVLLANAWYLCDMRTVGETGVQWAVTLNVIAGVYRVSFFNSGANVGTTTAVPINAWTHVAVVRSGTTVKLYVNGVADATTFTMSGTILSGTTPCIGSKDSHLAGYGTQGFIEDFRISGVARYTSDFTPSTSALPSPVPDPYESLISAQLDMDVASGSTAFVDNKGAVVTRSGTAVSSGAKARWGATSLLLAASGGLSIPHAAPLTSWTAECWVNIPIGTQQTLMGFYNASNIGVNMWVNPSGQLVVDDGSNAQTAFTGATIPANTWTHIAFSKNGTVTQGYINGVLVGSNSFAPAATITRFQVGFHAASSFPVTGNIDRVRVTNGVARYNAAFTPAVANDPYYALTGLLMHMDGVAGGTVFTEQKGKTVTVQGGTITTSSTQAKFGRTSLTCAAGGLRIPYSTDFDFGSGNFTVEAWFFPTSTAAIQRALTYNLGVATNSQYAWVLMQLGSDYTFSIVNSNTGYAATATAAVVLNTWQHVAFCRVGNVGTIYINGIAVGTSNLTGIVPNQSTSHVLTVSGDFNGAERYIGYMDDLRITKGVARYNANFVPETAAFRNA